MTDQGYNASHVLQDVFGSWSNLDNQLSGDPNVPVAFEFTAYPDDTACGCAPAYPDPTTYFTPVTGDVVDQTPLFRWAPTQGASGYFVVVARDANFTSVIDYAWTRESAYAPRFGANATSYGDETTGYYWAVLPAQNADGTNPLTAVGSASPQTFDKSSSPPDLLAPAGGATTGIHPTFRWGYAHWARTYTIQVATDQQFSDVLETVKTASTSYTPDVSYPADKSLYWRVRANDWNNIGLTWSQKGVFTIKLPSPKPDPNNLAASELVPTWRWSPVQGAVSYDVQVEQPDGVKKLLKGFRFPAFTPTKLDGTGLWRFQVRAVFPTKSSFTVVTGPFSPRTVGVSTTPYPGSTFRNSMSAPTGATTPNGGSGAVFAWTPKTGAAKYQVEVSNQQDFSTTVERIQVDAPTYAPVMKNPAYKRGGSLYWRVAAVDDSGNVGEMTKALPFQLPMSLKISTTGLLHKGKSTKFTVTVTDLSRNVIRGAKVSIRGAGLKKSGTTKSNGKLVLKLKPRKRGKLTITVSKSGTNPRYKTATITLTVR
jgi:hypothetical protein